MQTMPRSSRAPLIPEGWVRFGPAAIGRGEWSIARYVVQGVVSYGLWRGTECHGYFDSAMEAAGMAERIDLGGQA